MFKQPRDAVLDPASIVTFDKQESHNLKLEDLLKSNSGIIYLFYSIKE